MLGLVPIFSGSNEEAKHKAAKLLQDGAVFAFGLSEKEHGADIMSSDMMLKPQDDGTYVGDGDKYYIGNGNEAAMVSTFARMTDTGEYVFFVVDSRHDNYECIKNTVNHQNYVSEYAIHDYPITEGDILERGDQAWYDMLNTVNVCKFNLGFGAIGLCTHALYEAMDHAANRELYGRMVTDMPHVKRMFSDAYCRLVAMKVFSYRAIDYMRSASLDDRRYLLYNPMVKAKVTMQGEEVKNLLHEIIAAKGFEAEPFFEIPAAELGMMPKLEGTAHINIGLIVKFMSKYMMGGAEYPEIPTRNDTGNDEFLFDQGPTSGLGEIRFPDLRIAYSTFDSPNARVFQQQIAALGAFLMETPPDKGQSRDIDYMLALGEIFCLIPYGQLVLEGRKEWEDLDDALLDQIFEILVRDFNKHATELYGRPSNSDRQRELILDFIKPPASNAARFEKVWNEHVYALAGQYRMWDQEDPA
jgi:acyl-CoA dehydrogenase